MNKRRTDDFEPRESAEMAAEHELETEEQDRVSPHKKYTDAHQDKPLFYLGKKQDLKDEAIDDLAVMAKEAWQIVADANTAQTRFFVSNQKPVYLHLNDTVELQLLSPAMLKSLLSELAYFYFHTMSIDGSGNVRVQYKTRTAPPFLLTQMLNNPLFAYPLPELERIVTAPYFTTAYTLHQQPGYHAAAKTYYHLTDQRLEGLKIPAKPTPEQVTDARRLILEELLIDFPFSSDAERANAVATLIEPFIRGWFDVTPFRLIESARCGTGKGLLVDALMFPFLGEFPTRITEEKNSEGWKKLITTLLLGVPSVIFFDNIKRPVNDGNLESILTDRIWGDRMLGSNTRVRLINQATWLFAGNNVQIGEDIGRRTVRIRLVAKTANPNQRRAFVHPELRDWTQDHRKDIVTAALTLIQHWIAQGKPLHDDSPLLGSYEKWSRLMHGILTVNEIPGFLGNLQEMIALEKSDWDDITELIQILWNLHKEATFLTNDVFTVIQADENIPVNLGNGNDRSQRSTLGRLLSRNRDRVFLVHEETMLADIPTAIDSEVQFLAQGVDHSAKCWRLKKLTEHWTATVETQAQADKLYEIWALAGEVAHKDGRIVPDEPTITITPPPRAKLR